MRYTTVIDISEFPVVYRNMNARALYLHMALKSGWHDENRDQLAVSIRQLAAGVGLTVSATRHALAVLAKAQLIRADKEKKVWHVKKWHLDTPPSPRPRKNQAAAAAQAGDIGAQWDEQVRQWQDAVMKAVREMSREELQEWLCELEQGHSKRHHGAWLKPNERHIEWLKGIIKKKE